MSKTPPKSSSFACSVPREGDGRPHSEGLKDRAHRVPGGGVSFPEVAPAGLHVEPTGHRTAFLVSLDGPVPVLRRTHARVLEMHARERGATP